MTDKRRTARGPLADLVRKWSFPDAPLRPLSPARERPRHFWPAAAPFSYGPRGRVACGRPTTWGGIIEWTSTPVDVTCRACIRSRLVQFFLAAGTSAVRLDDDDLVSWGLLRR